MWIARRTIHRSLAALPKEKWKTPVRILPGKPLSPFVSTVRHPYSPVMARYFSTPADPKAPSPPEPPKQLSRVQRIVQMTKDTVHHYWMGSKLLAADLSISYRLIRKVTRGHTLTRRERRLLTLTASNMLRLVPFLFFVIVPFMEFLLPFALKLFPNMLPSTFADKHHREETKKKELKLRLELAAFQQDALAEYLKESDRRLASSQNEYMAQVLAKVRRGEIVGNEMIVELAKLFKNTLTLENLPRKQLIWMCRYMGLPAYGPDNMLRFNLSQRFESLRKDDQLISYEGIQSLSPSELASALRERGFRTIGESVPSMQESLAEWLSLSLEHKIPPVLLILSRSLNITGHIGGEKNSLDAIQATLGVLDDIVVDEAMLEKGVGGLDKVLDSINRQKTRIEDELKLQDSTREEREKVEYSSGDLKDVFEALSTCVSESALQDERERLEDLIEKLESNSPGAVDEVVDVFQGVGKETKERIASVFANREDKLGNILRKGLQAADEGKEQDAVQERLEKYLRKTLTSIKTEIEKADEAIGDKLNLLDKDKDGVISYQEMRDFLVEELKEFNTDEVAKSVFDRLDLDKDGVLDEDDVQRIRDELEKIKQEALRRKEEDNEETDENIGEQKKEEKSSQ